jgi:hypothetical protein
VFVRRVIGGVLAQLNLFTAIFSGSTGIVKVCFMSSGSVGRVIF